jgi:hypothetical protein
MPKEHPVKLMIRLLLFLSFNYWGASHVDLDLLETTLHSVWLELYQIGLSVCLGQFNFYDHVFDSSAGTGLRRATSIFDREFALPSDN